MSKQEAIRELGRNINTGGGHAVLLRAGRSWYTELHAGAAGNCCCNEHEHYVWREASYYTNPAELRTI